MKFTHADIGKPVRLRNHAGGPLFGRVCGTDPEDIETVYVFVEQFGIRKLNPQDLERGEFVTTWVPET